MIALDRLESYFPQMRAIRRDLHRFPETRFEETRTAAQVAGHLRDWGFDVAEGVGGTGVVGTLRGRLPGDFAIALRADMDALDIQEANDFEHRSCRDGKMHACGHDGHTAMLLYAARYLGETRDFAGVLHVIFQPAEEGGRGARAMLDDGLFTRFPCDAIYGMHNKPGIAAGRFGICAGPMMAACDYWTAVFRGTGGHGGSAPHLAVDAMMPAAHFLIGLQAIIGRNVPAAESAVISAGYLAGGSFSSPNVMPAEVTVRGTARWYRRSVGQTVKQRMQELADGLARAHRCQVELQYEHQVVALVNDPVHTEVAARAAASVAGSDRVDRNMRPVTGGEDFAYLLERKPGALIMIGNGLGADGSFHNLHTPRYEFNDDILMLGARYWIELVQQQPGAASTTGSAPVSEERA